MNGPWVSAPPPCPLLIGPGGRISPMHVFTARGPSLVAANDPAPLWTV